MAERYPIVFFPGVMGSRLRFESSDQYWDPDNTWRMLRWAPVWPFRSDDDNRREWHAREPAGVLIDPLDDSVDAEGVDHGWGGVVWSFYGTYLQHLRTLAAGRQAFAVGYDWRQDIRWLGGEYAAEKLRDCLEQTGAEKLWLVSHSMGGLVVRSAFLSAPDLVHRIDKVLHVCQPSTGAVILYRRLFTGLVRGLDGGGGVSDRAFRLLLGDSRAAFVGNMSGQPGPLQLLPSESFPADEEGQPWNGALAGTPFAGLYGNADSPPGLDDGNLQLPAEARDDLVERIQDVADFFAWLGAPRRPDLVPPETWLIYGTGRDTETRITFADGTPQPVVTEDGDGTVPSLSATALGLAADRQFAVAGLGHATACQDGRVRELTSQVF